MVGEDVSLHQRDLLHAYGIIHSIDRFGWLDKGDRELYQETRVAVSGQIKELARSLSRELIKDIPEKWVPQYWSNELAPKLAPHLKGRQWYWVPSWKFFMHNGDLSGRSTFFALLSCEARSDLEPFIKAVQTVALKGGRIADFPPMPKGTVGVLLRFANLSDASGVRYPSKLCEEVLMREFLYPELTVDPSTSDWRGTNYKIWRYDRDKEELVFIDVDEPCFIGVTAGAPDPFNSFSSTVTTNRMNCMECHSSEFYGSFSLYSLRTDRKEVKASPEERALQDDLN